MDTGHRLHKPVTLCSRRNETLVLHAALHRPSRKMGWSRSAVAVARPVSHLFEVTARASTPGGASGAMRQGLPRQQGLQREPLAVPTRRGPQDIRHTRSIHQLSGPPQSAGGLLPVGAAVPLGLSIAQRGHLVTAVEPLQAATRGQVELAHRRPPPAGRPAASPRRRTGRGGAAAAAASVPCPAPPAAAAPRPLSAGGRRRPGPAPAGCAATSPAADRARRSRPWRARARQEQVLQVVGRQSQQAVGGHRAAAAHVQQSQPGRVAQQPSQVGIIHPTAAVSFRMATLSSSSAGNPGAGSENSEHRSLAAVPPGVRLPPPSFSLPRTPVSPLRSSPPPPLTVIACCIICRQEEMHS